MTKEEIYKEIEDIFNNEGIDVNIKSGHITENRPHGIDINIRDLDCICVDSGIAGVDPSISTGFISTGFCLTLDDIEKIVYLLKELNNKTYYRVQLLPENNYYNPYLNYDESDDGLFLDSAVDDVTDIKAKFTEEEYNRLFVRYPEFLPKFNKNDPRFIEVNQDEDEIENEIEGEE